MTNAFFETVGEALKRGDNVRFVGFGNFVVAELPARTGRNPRTSAAINISTKKDAKV